MVTWEMISARHLVTPAAFSKPIDRPRNWCVEPNLSLSIDCALFAQIDSRVNAPSSVFSSPYAHFTKTWGMASLSRIKKPSAERVGRFAAVSVSPLFLHSCKLLLLQLLSFDTHANCPGVGYPRRSGAAFASSACVANFNRYEFPDQTFPRLEWNIAKDTNPWH